MKTISCRLLCILIVAFWQVPQRILTGDGQDLTSSMVMSASEKSERGEKLINNVCNRAIYRDLCLSSLQSVPESKNADLSGLDTIALKLIAANATEIKNQVDKLLGDGTIDSSSRQGLGDCSENYKRAQGRIESSLKAVQTKGYNDIDLWVSGAIADAELCQEGLLDDNSPLTAQNTVFIQLCTTALTITNLLGSSGV